MGSPWLPNVAVAGAVEDICGEVEVEWGFWLEHVRGVGGAGR
jgi:hypothetical protein